MTPARVIAAGLMWRLFGRRRSAESLFEAVIGDDEQNQMLAGISLVRAGQRSFDFIAEKIAAGDGRESALRLLPDIDENRARVLLTEVAATQGDLANAARECLDSLDRIQAFDGAQG